MRRRIRLISIKRKIRKKQAPNDFTFEITTIDYRPIGPEFKGAARLLAKARNAHDDNVEEDKYLKFDSRHLRSGDWIVWAEDLETRNWLCSFFLTDDFINDYRATLISERGELIRYTVKVSWPDSEDDNAVIFNHVLYNIGNPGYFRLSDEIKWYSDPQIQKAHAQAKKNKKKYSPPPNSMFDKMFWVKVSPAVHKILQENWNRLRLGYGAGKLKMELAKGQEGLTTSKRPRSVDGDDEALARPAQAARREDDAPEIARTLYRTMSQLSLDQIDENETGTDNDTGVGNGQEGTEHVRAGQGGDAVEDAPGSRADEGRE